MRRMAMLAASLALLAGPALAQSKAQIQKLNDQFVAAFNKGDAAAVAAMYTQDATVLPAGAPVVKGRAAIEAMWRQQAQQLEAVKIETTDVKPLGGNAARELGTAILRTKSQPPQDVVVKYAVIWQKEGGRWKLLLDMWNMDK